MALYDTDPTAEKATNIAVITPQSPIRLVTKAFLPATAALLRVCQNEMRNEQVQVQEELRELWVTVHVPNRVQMDERTNSRDKQRHRDAERIGEERKINLQRTDGDPLEQRHHMGAFLGRHAEQVEVHRNRH
jgi:hypothetical protein